MKTVFSMKTCDGTSRLLSPCSSSRINFLFFLTSMMSLWQVNAGYSVWWSEICHMFTFRFESYVNFQQDKSGLEEEVGCHLSFNVSCPPATQTSTEDTLTSRETASLWLVGFYFILFYFHLFSQVETELRPDGCIREGVVKEQVDFHQSLTGCELKCLWAESKALCSVSFSFFFIPPAK